MISPCEIDYEESICTLRYASRVKFIKNRTRINIETKQGLIETFEREILELQKKVASLTLQEERAMKQVNSLFHLHPKTRYVQFYFLAEEKRERNI